MKELGEAEYHRATCAELELDPDAVALMGTAANMNYAALTVEAFADRTQFGLERGDDCGRFATPSGRADLAGGKSCHRKLAGRC